MNQTQKADIMLAKAQIALSFLFAFGIFGLVFFLLIDKSATSPPILTIVGSVIASLITVLTLQQNYFFARQRQSSLPDPSTGDPSNANPPIQSAPTEKAPVPGSPASPGPISPIGSDARV